MDGRVRKVAPTDASREPSPLKHERAEILDLIAKLRQASGGKLPRQVAMAPPAPSISDALRPSPSRRPPSMRPQIVAPQPRDQESAGEQAAIVASLRHIEQRLENIESRLSSREEKRRSVLPPANEPSTFQGIIQEQMLSDMLQLVCANAMTGIFTVESEVAKTKLYFREGKMFHAEGDDVEGENAFFAAFAVEVGRYAFLETEDLPGKDTITAGTQFLILDALRQIDENRKSMAPPES